MAVDSALKGARLEERIVLSALPAEVWPLISDVSAWGDWSRLYTASSGLLAAGETLTLSIALPGFKVQEVTAEVLAVEPPHGVLYVTRSLGGLILGQRYIGLHEALGGCRVRNGEVMGGPLGPVMAALMGARVRTALAQMNTAMADGLKRRSSALS